MTKVRVFKGLTIKILFFLIYVYMMDDVRCMPLGFDVRNVHGYPCWWGALLFLVAT